VKNYLVVSALGESRPNLVNDLSRTILECDCSVVNSRMMMLGNEFAAVVMVQGNWNTLARLEVQLKRLEQALGLTLIYKRTEEHPRQEDVLPYAVEVIALNHAHIVYELAHFFTHRSISIEDLTSRNYRAPHTGANMFSVNIVIGIPVDTHIATLREEFMDFCDQLNLDSVMEPIKG
jgi:glycine cleavage system transcriptional repressor